MTWIDDVVVAVIGLFERYAMTIEVERPPTPARNRIWSARLRDLRLKFERNN